MKLPSSVLAVLLQRTLHGVVGYAPSTHAVTPSNTTESGCSALSDLLPVKVFFPGDTVYEYEVENFWSNTQILKPAYIARPNTTEDVSTVIKTSRSTETRFAVRAGGHMPVRGANSVDDGILLVMSNLTRLAISPDRGSVDAGPGLTWSAVYAYLVDFERTAVGGRISPIGVPGLALGGGISFHGNQYGWAADNVLEYEVVLASGEVVVANGTTNRGLFWALKGGGPNFGVVTNFKLRTVPSTQVLAGIYTINGTEMAPLMDVS